MVDRLQKLLSRSTVAENIGIWGALHTNMRGELVGWLVDTWAEESLAAQLHPRMHWVPRTDRKFYQVKLSMGYLSSMMVLDEDTEIEVNRAALIKKTLELWEQQWRDEEARKA
ncbi:MAG: hypothetical protein WCC21_05315 [Candidatus Acidiferrales bacterium]